MQPLINFPVAWMHAIFVIDNDPACSGNQPDSRLVKSIPSHALVAVHLCGRLAVRAKAERERGRVKRNLALQ